MNTAVADNATDKTADKATDKAPAKTDRPASAPIVNTAAEWRDQLEKMASSKLPSFFHMRAQLPLEGRTNQVMGATPRLAAVLKTYASGGENELHAHSNEDHMFIILQGEAIFYGPKGEQREVAKNDCVMFPAGTFYWFQAKEGVEPLVFLRVGAVVDASKDVMARIDIDGNPFAGESEKNKEVPCVLSPDKWFE